MPAILLNLDALSHNARQTRALAGRWGVAVLPVLKAVASHPAAVRTLKAAGFLRFGHAEAGEAARSGDLGEKTLIQLASPAQAPLVVVRFQRSFQAAPETLAALDGAAGAAGLIHQVVLMVDLGDLREGLSPEDLPEALELVRRFRHLSVTGFGATVACLGDRLPDRRLAAALADIRRLFEERGWVRPEVSLGGSVLCDWVEREGPGAITELRLGDPFILGEDIYRLQDLPGGPFRRDVCILEAEVVEIRRRLIEAPEEGPVPHHTDHQERPDAVLTGWRLRALLAAGRFHTSLGSIDRQGAPILSRMVCHLPGAVITGLTAGYLVLDVTECRRPVRVGQKICFTPGYWSIAQGFRNPMMEIRPVRDEIPLTLDDRRCKSVEKSVRLAAGRGGRAQGGRYE